MKRWLALLLALVITLSCVPVAPVHAHEAEEPLPTTAVEETLPEEPTVAETLPEEPTVRETTPEQASSLGKKELIRIPVSQVSAFSGSNLRDNDQRFAAYVDSVFYPNRVRAQSISAGDRLSGDVKKMYDGICWLFKEVASGERADTTITIGSGYEYETTFTGGEPSIDDLILLMDAFLADLPYEQYWFDKTVGMGYLSVPDENGTLEGMYFEFYVAQNYQGEDELHTDTAITGAATKSAANARKIVADNAGKSDYNKLVAYSDTICDLVEYDHDAAANDSFSLDNDPWQIIHTFDRDPATNIVCEGYAKSFKYLCDQSNFSNSSIVSYTVTGTTTGPHMWNIVSIGGKNYLTDITAVDSGWDLLLAGASGRVTTYYVADGLCYTYDSYSLNLWGTGDNSILKLTSDPYNPDLCTNGHTPGPAPTCTAPQTCTVCGMELAPALGHIPGSEPTCEAGQTCTRCSAELQPALGHSPVTDPGTPPTCTQPGTTDGSHCGRCGVTLTPQEPLDPAGHTPGPEPTADAPQTCTVCGAILKDKLPHIQDCTISLPESMVYTGKALKPEVTIITPDGDVLVRDEDYSVAYKNNTSIGKATITVTGLGAYGGKTSVYFTISPGKVQNLRMTSVSSTSVKVAYDKVPGATGYQIYVDGVYKGSTASTSYTVKGLKAGTPYAITVEAKKTVSGTVYFGITSDPLTVVPGTSIAKYTASLSYSSTEYDGTEKCPTPKLRSSSKKYLVLGQDYTVTYQNNVEIGKATVTFTGMGKYVGTITKSFEIKLGKVSGVTWQVLDPTTLQFNFDPVPGAQYYKIYVGGKLKATVTEPLWIYEGLKTGTIYKITVKAAAESQGKEYVGTTSTSVSAKPTYDLTLCSASLSYTSTTYSGKSKSPSVTVLSATGSKLKKNTHYTVSYKANKSVGLATVTVTGKGSYAGTIVLNFEIVPAKISSLSFSSITGDSAKVSWKKVSGAGWYRILLDGKNVDITTSTAYTLTGLEAGKTHLVEVHAGKTVGDVDFCGAPVSKELIPTWDLSKFTLTLESDTVPYISDAVIPALTVTDSEGKELTEYTDYTVTGKNNTKVGKATVTVTGKGKYRGTITKSFKIVPDQVLNVALVSVTKTTAKISFDKVPGASTYYIYVNGKQKGSTSSGSYTIKSLKANTTYEITVAAAKKVSSTTYKGAASDVLTITTNS